MRYFILFYILTFFQQTKAQNPKYKSFQSIVLNSTDSSAVQWAHVQITNAGIGTIANNSGEFILHVADTVYKSYPDIKFGCIGFKSKVISLFDIDQNRLQYDSIFLEPETTYLREVIVTANKKDTLDIFLLKVIAKLKRNYANTTFYCEAFFRQISQTGESASRLVEAAIDIKDNGYSKHNSRIKIRINQLRKSNDYTNYSWIKNLYNLTFGSSNDILQTYNSDLLRPNKELTKKNAFNDFKEFKLDSIIGKGVNAIASITFVSHRNGDSILLFHKTRLLINLTDLAILRIEHSWTPNPKVTLVNTSSLSAFYHGVCRVKKTIEYQKIGSRYYPLFISVFEPVDGSQFANNEQSYKESIILVNKIDAKQHNQKIRYKEKENDDVDVYEKPFPFNPEFWETYNMVSLNPITDKDIFSLERKQNLNDQFIKNGYRSKKK